MFEVRRVLRYSPQCRVFGRSALGNVILQNAVYHRRELLVGHFQYVLFSAISSERRKVELYLIQQVVERRVAGTRRSLSQSHRRLGRRAFARLSRRSRVENVNYGDIAVCGHIGLGFELAVEGVEVGRSIRVGDDLFFVGFVQRRQKLERLGYAQTYLWFYVLSPRPYSTACNACDKYDENYDQSDNARKTTVALFRFWRFFCLALTIVLGLNFVEIYFVFLSHKLPQYRDLFLYNNILYHRFW